MAMLTSVHNLSVVHPNVAREWHPSKNGKLTPRDVTLASAKKVWWMCARGHEWQSIIRERTKGSGCPDCYGKRKKGHNLRIDNPKLAKEWHPTKNNGVQAKDVSSGSVKKVWWICKQGHEWEARINNRHRGVGCPVCGRVKAWKTRRKKRTAMEGA